MSNTKNTWLNDGQHIHELAALVRDEDEFVREVITGSVPKLITLSNGRRRSFAMAVEGAADDR